MATSCKRSTETIRAKPTCAQQNPSYATVVIINVRNEAEGETATTIAKWLRSAEMACRQAEKALADNGPGAQDNYRVAVHELEDVQTVLKQMLIFGSFRVGTA